LARLGGRPQAQMTSNPVLKTILTLRPLTFGAIATEKLETYRWMDVETDERHYNFSRAHFYKLFYVYKPFYVFDLRPVESSMLFAVFRPLRTPVLNYQSSHFTYLSMLGKP
jgi:hypothetical protein